MTGTNIIGLVLAGMMAFIWWQIRQNQGALGKALFKEGVAVYVTKKECIINHDKYQRGICNKIDDIKEIIKEMDVRRDEARKDDAAWKEKMSHSLGRIEGKLT